MDVSSSSSMSDVPMVVSLSGDVNVASSMAASDVSLCQCANDGC